MTSRYQKNGWRMARLNGVLTEPAAKLYELLLVTGGLALDEHAEVAGSQAARELIDQGFARERYVGTPMLVPTEPARAVDNALLGLQRRIF